MAVTQPDEIRTPDAGSTYALTQDLLAMADTIQDALNRLRNRFVTGTVTFVGDGVPAIVVSVTFDTPFAATPSVFINGANTPTGANLGTMVTAVSRTGFTARMASNTGSFNSTYTVAWLAVGTPEEA